MINAVSKSGVAIEQFNRKWNSIEASDELFETGEKIADTVEEDSTMLRAVGKQRHRVNAPAETYILLHKTRIIKII